MTSVVKRIEPKTVNLTFKTSPAGLSLAVGAEQSAPAPFTQEWVVNSQVQLNAPAQQTVGGTSYAFGRLVGGRCRDAHAQGSGFGHDLHRDLHRRVLRLDVLVCGARQRALGLLAAGGPARDDRRGRERERATGNVRRGRRAS